VISAETQKVMNDAIAVLRAQGAIVDDRRTYRTRRS